MWRDAQRWTFLLMANQGDGHVCGRSAASLPLWDIVSQRDGGHHPAAYCQWGGGDRGLVSGLQRGCVPSLLQVISKSRTGASHFRKHIPHSPMPGQASSSLSLFLALSFQKNIFPSLFFSVSFSLSCWAFTTGQFPHQSERRLNKHQKQMSEGACK